MLWFWLMFKCIQINFILSANTVYSMTSTAKKMLQTSKVLLANDCSATMFKSKTKKLNLLCLMHALRFQPACQCKWQKLANNMQKIAERVFVKLWYPDEHKWWQFASHGTTKMQSTALKGCARTPCQRWSSQIEKGEETFWSRLSADSGTSMW